MTPTGSDKSFFWLAYRYMSWFWSSSKNTWQMSLRFVLWCCDRVTTGGAVLQRQVILKMSAFLKDGDQTSAVWLILPLWKNDVQSGVTGSFLSFQIHVAQTSSVWWNRDDYDQQSLVRQRPCIVGCSLSERGKKSHGVF